MTVLSLFDGISGGYESLTQCGIPVEKYYAYEINKHSIEVAKKNHKNIEEMGSVVGADFPQADLLIGGSPCQDFSSLNKEKLGLEGSKSSLFYEYVRALKTNPRYFFLENVASMGKKNAELLTNILKTVRDDVNFYYIDSAQDGPMHRRRYYWTNIPLSPSKEDTRVLADVLYDKEEFKSKSRSWSQIKPADIYKKFPTIVRTKASMPIFKLNNIEYFPGPITCERLFGFPDNYTIGTDNIRRSILGDGWCLYTINRFFENL